MARARKILLVTYEFPPKGGTGAQRCLKYAKYLPEFGWEPTILTVADPPVSIRDEALLAEIPGVPVARAYSLEPTRVFFWVKRMLGSLRPARDRADGPPESGQRNLTGLPTGLIKFIQAFFVPDEKIGWRPFAERMGRRLIKEFGPDIIMSSGPPNTAHLIGERLARISGLPYVADFRDPWVGHFYLTPPTRIHAALDRMLERRVVESADLVVSVSPTMTERFRGRYSRQAAEKFVTVTNGFDPDDLDFNVEPSSDKFVLIYAGTFYGDISAKPILAAVGELLAAGRLSADEFEFQVVGPLDPETQREIERFKLEKVVSRPGFKPRAEALQDIGRATAALLVVGAGPAGAPILTTKLFDYLALRRPMLALVPEGDAADVVLHVGAGLVVEPEDIAGIKEALITLVCAWRDGRPLAAYKEGETAGFERRRLAGELASLLSSLSK